MYENCADIIGLDFYKKFYELSAAKLVLKYLKLKCEHDGEIWGVGAVKYSPSHIKHQVKFWKLLGVKNMLWYSFTMTQEIPPWASNDLDGMPDYQKALKEANEKM